MSSLKHLEGTMDMWAIGPMKSERKSFEALFKFCCKSVKANNHRFSEYKNLQMAHLEAVCC